MNSLKQLLVFTITGSLLIILILPLSAEESQSTIQRSKRVLVEIFFRQHCPECNSVKEEVIPDIQAEFADYCSFQWLDLKQKDNYLRLSAYLEFFSITNNAPVYIVINKNYMLSGITDIRLRLRDTITRSITCPTISTFDYQKMQISLIEKRAQRFTLIAVFIAGLIDGINPCIFATLVFFISILISTKTSGSKMLAIGGIYCLSCFLTYFALGFGIFNFLHLLSGYSMARQILECSMIVVLCIFAFLSFIDALKFRASQKPEDVLLQLPDRLKKYTHNIMRDKLKMRYLLGGVFLIGILVTIIESTCTGQVYIPTLVLLTKEKGAGIWLFYLLVYNVAFIIPLLIVFGTAWRGTSSMSFISWSKKHVVYSKILLSIFFLLMSILLILLQ